MLTYKLLPLGGLTGRREYNIKLGDSRVIPYEDSNNYVVNKLMISIRNIVIYNTE